jgi:hypothetical protein
VACTMNDISPIVEDRSDGKSVYSWGGDTDLCALSDELFAEIYSGAIPDCRLDGLMLQFGQFHLTFVERRDNCLVFRRNP